MRILIVIVTCLLCTPAWCEIYKQVDKDGNVVYTDVPNKKNAKPLKVQPVTTFKSGNSSRRFREGGESGSSRRDKDNNRKDYKLAISSPSHDEAIRADNGSVTIQASVNPGLASNHTLVFFIDGNEISKGSNSQTSAQDLARGSHTAQVKITANQTVIASSKVITFHLLRTSILSNGAKKAKTAPKAKAAPKARMAK